MLGNGLLLAFVASAMMDWGAVASGRKKLEFVFKPLTIVLLLYAVVSSRSVSAVEGTVLAICLALLLSLAGDIFLMLPRDFFVPGLGSFLLAHLAYIAAFADYASVSLRWAIPAAIFVGVGIRLGRQIVMGLDEVDRRELRVPVVAYMVVITVMVVTVLATDSVWGYLGALLFFASDAMIGWSRFVRPFEWDRVAIMITYHVGQVLLVTGALDLYVNG